MFSKVILITLGLVALVAADSRETYSYADPRATSGSEESYESSEAQYNFQYAVSDDSSSNEFGHQETRDGDRTDGSYYVQLPDGRLQRVTYFVDGDSGYVAEVTYEGEAQYPESNESGSDESFEAPRYVPPRARYSAPDSNESK